MIIALRDSLDTPSQIRIHIIMRTDTMEEKNRASTDSIRGFSLFSNSIMNNVFHTTLSLFQPL